MTTYPQAAYAPMFVSSPGSPGQPFYVLPAGSFPPSVPPSVQPVQYVVPSQHHHHHHHHRGPMFAPPSNNTVPQQQPMFVQYPPPPQLAAAPTPQQPQQQQQHPHQHPQHPQQVQYVIMAPAPMYPPPPLPQHQQFSPPTHTVTPSKKMYTIGLPQMAGMDNRPPPPYNTTTLATGSTTTKSLEAAGDPNRTLGSGTYSDSQELGSGSMESIVCRHFLEAKCNRRKCRFKHTTSPQCTSITHPSSQEGGDTTAHHTPSETRNGISQSSMHHPNDGFRLEEVGSINAMSEEKSVADLLSRLQMADDGAAVE